MPSEPVVGNTGGHPINVTQISSIFILAPFEPVTPIPKNRVKSVVATLFNVNEYAVGVVVRGPVPCVTLFPLSTEIKALSVCTPTHAWKHTLYEHEMLNTFG